MDVPCEHPVPDGEPSDTQGEGNAEDEQNEVANGGQVDFGLYAQIMACWEKVSIPKHSQITIQINPKGPHHGVRLVKERPNRSKAFDGDVSAVERRIRDEEEKRSIISLPDAR